jgi:PAS domain S-box-containing protein
MVVEQSDSHFERLRGQAEAVLTGRVPNLDGFGLDDLQKLIHELQVHQLELQLQNEALRESQEALALARDEYAELYDRAPVGYLMLDGEGRIVRANATSSELLAAEAHALVDKPLHRFVAPEDQDAYHFFLLGLESGQGRGAAELTLVHGDGSRFRAHLEAVIWGEGARGGQQWLATVRDVTAEYEAQQALRRSEALEAARQTEARQVARLMMLADLSEVLAGTLDPGEVAGLALGRIAKLVRATEAFLVSYTRELGGGEKWVLTLDDGWVDLEASDGHARWRQPLETLRRQRMDTSQAPHPVSRFVTAWGSEALVVPLGEGETSLADLVLEGRAFGDDDVALVRAAAGRASQALGNARLYEEVCVLLRQREEFQAQIVQSEKLAALGRLTASLAHEINNPVQAVLGCLGLAEAEFDHEGSAETVERYLTVAMREVRRIADLVGRMREFYRPSSEERAVICIDDVLEAVVDLTRHDLKGRRVVLDWVREAELPCVPACADQLKQVFLNLILNAADAMPEGGALTLHSALGELRQNGRAPVPAVRIDVQDAGLGMTPEVRQRLFEPFFSTKRGGTGLGLYICHRIVEAHGGQIDVDSREGEGTRITVWLPIEPPEDEQYVAPGRSMI